MIIAEIEFIFPSDFEQKRYRGLKEENPTLKRSQLKELLWKEWQKSPENPMNQL